VYLALSPGAVSIRPTTLDEAISAALAGPFEGLEIDLNLARQVGAEGTKDRLRAAGLHAAGFGLPIDFRKDDAPSQDALDAFARDAELAAEIGLTRCATWIMPASDKRTFDENFAFHAERLRPLAKTLADNGIAFGLEFVGPKTLRSQFAHEFVYDIAGMSKLAEAVGANLGFLVDSFHWYCTGSDLEALRGIPLSQVVYVHINDARPGRGPEEQVDSERELPAETGVIDAKAFLTELKAKGYDGPLVAEPFLDLSHLPDDATRARLIADAGRRMLAVAFG